MTAIQRRRRHQHYGSSPSALPLSNHSTSNGSCSHQPPTRSRKSGSIFHPLYFSLSFAIVIIILVLGTRHTSQIASSTSSQPRRFSAAIKSQLSPSYVDLLEDQMTKVYDVVVIGCGPAGLTASLYASRM